MRPRSRPSARRFSAAAGVLVAALVAALPLAPPASAEPDDCGDGPRLRYVVLYRPGTGSSDAAAETRRSCGEVAAYYGEIGVGVVDSADPGFARRMGPDRAYSAEHAVHDDRRTGVSRNDLPGPATGEAGWNLRQIRADQARAVLAGSPDVVVGVLDSGIDATHPALAGAVDPRLSANCLRPENPRLSAGPQADPHGTHVAGVVAASGDGGGVTGVAPGTRLAAIRVVDPEGYAHPEYAVCGFMWAAQHGVDVANSSFLVESAQAGCAGGGSPVPREAVRRAVAYATSRGVLTVAAAGNERVDLTAVPRNAEAVCDAVPGNLDGVVSVGAVGPDAVKAGYSSYGLGAVDLVAPGGVPGECVRSTVPGGYGAACGTSMAAPHVSGVAALLKARHPEAGPDELRRMLLRQARPLSCPADYDLNGDSAQDAVCRGYAAYNGFYGHGLVDARNAVTG